MTYINTYFNHNLFAVVGSSIPELDLRILPTSVSIAVLLLTIWVKFSVVATIATLAQDNRSYA